MRYTVITVLYCTVALQYINILYIIRRVCKYVGSIPICKKPLPYDTYPSSTDYCTTYSMHIHVVIMNLEVMGSVTPHIGVVQYHARGPKRLKWVSRAS